MKKYRTKPCEIEAVQFTRYNFQEIHEFTKGTAIELEIEGNPNGKVFCTIDTLEGPMRATENDYIIKGLRGEYYPCKPDVFEKKYEEINNE